MAVIIILLATGLTIFKKDIKDLSFYSIEIENPTISYELNTKDQNNNNLNKLNYRPNVHNFIGVSAGNKYGALFITAQTEEEEKKEIDASKVFDIQLLGTYQNYLWEINYQNYQGLYITDTEFLASDLPKVNSWSYGASVKYFTKENYQLRQSLGNFSKDKITNWSWLYGLYLNKSRIFSDETLIPTQYEANFEQLKNLKALETTNFGIDGGISGLYSYKSYFITAMVSMGYHIQQQEFSGLDSQDRTVTQLANSVLLGLGYDFKNGSSIGLQGRSQSITIPVKNAEYIQKRNITSVYYKYFF